MDLLHGRWKELETSYVAASHVTGMDFLHGRWKELETSNAYVVASHLQDLKVVNNPAKDDRTEYEIRIGPRGTPQLYPIYYKDTINPDTPSELFIHSRIPGRIVWFSLVTGRQKTWQLTTQTWNTTGVQLMCEAEDTDFGLVMRKLTGELIAKVTLQPGTKWRDARKKMVPGLRPLLSKKLAFVSPRGEVLTQAHDEQPLPKLLGCAACEPEPTEEWRRFQ